MHTVDLLEEALVLAEKMGFELRKEWLGEAAGGACRLGSRWILYVNLTLPIDEQLGQVIRALRQASPAPDLEGVSLPLARLLQTK
jgi:hypothetical protein